MLSSSAIRAPSARSRQPPPERSRSSTASPSCCRLALHVGMQVEAQREGLRRRRLDHVLAAHVLAALGQIQPAAMDAPNGFFQPSWLASSQCAPFGLLALRLDHLRPAAEPVRLQLAAVHVGDHQGGVRGGRAGRVAPFRRCRPGTRRN